jgi:hypothetical protein
MKMIFASKKYCYMKEERQYLKDRRCNRKSFYQVYTLTNCELLYFLRSYATFYKTWISLLCLQEPAAGSCPESDEPVQ